MIPPLRIEKLFFLNFFFFNLKNFLQLNKNLKKKKGKIIKIQMII